MKANLRSGIVLAAVAGFACSVAQAQVGGAGQQKPARKIQKITHMAQAETPTWIECNGVRYPYQDLGGLDDNYNIYQNGVGTTSHTQWFSDAYNAAVTPPAGGRSMDDISF